MLTVTSYDCIDYEKKYGMLEVVYYMTQPISVLGTFLAILVAIFGVEIKNLFFLLNVKCIFLVMALMKI